MKRGLALLGALLVVLVSGAPAAVAAPGVHPVAVPEDARAVDTSLPDRTVGDGTPASCTSAAVVSAVAAGGVITFDCGPKPVTIAMTRTAKVVNTSPRIVLDGGGLVTLERRGERRILYLDTCDQAQSWTTVALRGPGDAALMVQHLTFTRRRRDRRADDGGGGGAIFVRGGRFKVVDSTFVDNSCDRTGPDLGGAAIRALDQYHDLPVYIAGSTFSGGRCSQRQRRCPASGCRGRSSTAPSPTTRRSATARTRPGSAPRGWQRWCDLSRRQRVHGDARRHEHTGNQPTRAAARSSSSATTTPGR